MTNDKPKCQLCNGSGYVTEGEYESGYQHIPCPDCDPKPLPSKCPVCLTVQTGAHTCKRAKPSCEHEEQFLWRDKLTNETQSKTAHESCPFCKPAIEIRKDCQEGKVYGFNPDYMKKEVEPSVEEKPKDTEDDASWFIKHYKINETHAEHDEMKWTIRKMIAGAVLEAVRNERNRK